MRRAKPMLFLEADPGELLLEARKPAATVEQLLLAASPGRMGLRIDIEAKRVAFLAPSGAGGEFAAVGHDDLDGMIVRVSLGFHGWSWRPQRRARRYGVAEVAAL